MSNYTKADLSAATAFILGPPHDPSVAAPSEPTAPPGQVYVCQACGKISRGQYGFGGDRGWDESCMLNSVLCTEDSLGRDPVTGRVVSATAVEGQS